MLATTCPRCRRSFEASFSPPPGVKWYTAEVSSCCPDCKPDLNQAVRAAHLTELQRGLRAGELSPRDQRHSLCARELQNLCQGRMEELPKRLVEAGVTLIPLDWWHVHLDRVIKDLAEQGWRWRPSREEPILLQLLSNGRWARWTRPVTELPHAAVLELFHQGEVSYVVRAMHHGRPQRPRGHRRLCQAARAWLTHPEARTRFGALFVLMCVDPHPALTEFLDIAGDPCEHPRVRGLAVEALKECETGVWFRETRLAETRRTWKALVDFIQDSEPEVRWWACFIVGLMGTRCGAAYQQSLVDSLRQVAGDPTPAGFGWSVGKAAQDALDVFEGREPPERLVNFYRPYDPWVWWFRSSGRLADVDRTFGWEKLRKWKC